jgi:ferredoxin-type protein NapG
MARTVNRRTFMTGLGAASLIAGWTGSLTLLAKRSQAKDFLLRPPGALEEERFLASCIKCGQCVQVCPYHSIKLLDLFSGVNMGTPVIEAARRGCYLCDLFPCVLCCPSGALNPEVQEINQVHMGVVEVRKPERCWAGLNKHVTETWVQHLVRTEKVTDLEASLNEKICGEKGRVCRLCTEVCPIEDRERAIKLEKGRPVIGEQCVGCGACEEVCPEDILHVVPWQRRREAAEGTPNRTKDLK